MEITFEFRRYSRRTRNVTGETWTVKVMRSDLTSSQKGRQDMTTYEEYFRRTSPQKGRQDMTYEEYFEARRQAVRRQLKREAEEILREERRLTGRYHLGVTMEEFRGHRGVRFGLFHRGDLPEDVYAAMISRPGLRTDPDARSLAEATFSAGEAAALRRWFATWPGVRSLNQSEAYTVLSGYIGNFSGGDFYNFSQHEGWPLPSEVWGHFDLAYADDGPCVRKPNLDQV
jgi:hypothetical protein